MDGLDLAAQRRPVQRPPLRADGASSSPAPALQGNDYDSTAGGAAVMPRRELKPGRIEAEYHTPDGVGIVTSYENLALHPAAKASGGDGGRGRGIKPRAARKGSVYSGFEDVDV